MRPGTGPPTRWASASGSPSSSGPQGRHPELSHPTPVSQESPGARPVILISLHGGPQLSPLSSELPAGSGSPWKPTLQLPPSGWGRDAQWPHQGNVPTPGSWARGTLPPPTQPGAAFPPLQQGPRAPCPLGCHRGAPRVGEPLSAREADQAAQLRHLPKRQTDLQGPSSHGQPVPASCRKPRGVESSGCEQS